MLDWRVQLMIACCLLLSDARSFRPPQDKLIVGGDDASIKDLPHHAILILFEEGIELKKGRFCGSVIIDSRWLLTVAHCLEKHPEGPEISAVKVLVGVDNLMDDGTIYNIESYQLHELYYHNDIALMKTAQVIEYNERVQPVALPKPWETVHEYESVLITGIGFNYSGNYQTEQADSLKLKAAKIPIISECSQAYGSTIDPAFFFCGGNNKTSATSGDSGGGAVRKFPRKSVRNCSWILLGLVKSGLNSQITLFVRVSAYLGWIDRVKSSS